MISRCREICDAHVLGPCVEFVSVSPLSFLFVLRKQHNSLEPFPNIHTLSRSISIGDCGNMRQPVSARTDHTGQGEARSLPRALPVPCMKPVAFDVVSRSS